MNAEAFRYLFDYHMTENRKMWDSCANELSYEQFAQPAGYSHGSVRDQVVHLIDVEEIWFSELQNKEPLEGLAAAEGDDRNAIRARWDAVEQILRDYLAGLKDEMLFEKPIREPDEDRGLITWQVLLQVANHGTDHRAQVLRSLNELGVKTDSQDFIFYVYDHP